MDSLDLHLESEVVLPYKLYLGRVQENLLQLLSEQRQPMGAWDFTQRLKEVEEDHEVLEPWNNICPILGDAIAIHPYGSVRIIRGNQRLWDYIARSRLREGVVELLGKKYDTLGGAHILGSQMLRYNRDEDDLRNVFSYLRISPDREIHFPAVRNYPYLTLLAFSNSGRILGTSSLDENACLVGIK